MPSNNPSPRSPTTTPARPIVQQASDWHPSSWATKPIKQDVTYDDPDHLQRVLQKLGHLPPMVVPGEIHRLRSQLADVALGKAFLLQGGDCAELFEYCSRDPIESKLKVLLQMSLVLIWGSRMPVVRMARMAGQYAKPRSSPTEKLADGTEVISFRGDNVNGFAVTERKPDPERLIGAYFHSAATLNYLRGILGAGFADLNHPSSWNLDHVRSSPLRNEYQTIVDRLLESLEFMKTIGADATSINTFNTVDMFVSHEGLLLEYEQALTRLLPDPTSNTGEYRYYNTSGHFIWIGDRTRQLDGAHVEYFRGIVNPIGVKVGPSMKDEELGPLLDKLNPDKEIGKITLITRYGADKVEKHLPGHINAVKESGHTVVWMCDPMHGNTKTSTSSPQLKTRHFEDIIKELSKAIRVHKANSSNLNGVHFELTGEAVTECIGGSMDLLDADLSTNYQTYCDPRLNYEQSLDMAFLIAKYHQREREEQERKVYNL